ncbi:MAG: alpha/beta hydrolase [Gammaproteobacteria bacterium]|nr:MAG: alpha/beta hydrolase [Gammaproteobacteria bacterium]
MNPEAIVNLGGDRFGLLNAPDVHAEDRVCLLLLNAGFIHRSGPFRLHVRLARRLAQAGIASFRFDAPGIGDALARSDRPLLETMRADMDVLERKHGLRRFVVGGLCSAADLGWQLALTDPRVIGVISIDGLARTGCWYRWARLRRLLAKPPRAWLASLLRRTRRRASPAMSADELRDWPEQGIERVQIGGLVQRGVALLFVFTGGAGYFLHPRQFGETYGAASKAESVQFDHWPQCDHTFFKETDRRKLIEHLAQWMTRRFAP